MKASQVGNGNKSRVLDHFQSTYSWHGYFKAKYDGFLPENTPKREDFKEVNEAIYYHKSIGDPDRLIPKLLQKKNKLIKRINSLQKEWLKLQTSG